jgi:2-polyprenyl-3-methyl-5-hydroxy-6-metoxy-1,4-benzoquinol methylase
MIPHCPFCLSEQYSSSYLPDTFFNGKLFKYIKCKNCHLIYVNPLPKTDDYAAMYPPSYQSGINHEVLSDPNKKLPGLRFSYQKHFELIHKFSPSKKILDYGCGQANFLINAIHHGFECDGTEYNLQHIEILKKEIPKSAFYSIEEFISTNDLHYDVIRLSNVLEHLENPKTIIEKLILKLNDNGLLLVEGPIETNFSIALLFRKLYFKSRKLLQENWTVNHPPTHLLFSNAKNQRDFFSNFTLTDLHFEIMESEWPFPEKPEDVKSFGAMFKYCIAKLSIVFSMLLFSKWGNTFIYVGRKN